MSYDNAAGHFPPTAWTLLEAARGADNAKSSPAMNDFIGRYWKPVFCFIRARGYAFHQAEELTQDFMIHKILSPDWMAKANRERGRFRNFLLKTLQGFLADQGPKRAPRQKTFQQGFVSVGSLVDDEERNYEPASNETPETIFMRKWALEVVNRALQRVKQFYADQGQPDWYELFDAGRCENQSDNPLATEGASGRQLSQEDLGRKYGVSRDQVRYRLDIVQKQFERFLHEEVRDQVGSETEVKNEVGELLILLRA